VLPAGEPVYWLVPGDPRQWTGGYLYNANIIRELRAAGQPVSLVRLDGCFPQVDAQTLASARVVVRSLPDAAIVVVDGLAYGALPEVWAAERQRLRLIALCHLPLAEEYGLPDALAAQLRQRESWALASALGVITTSRHCARLLTGYGLDAERLAVVEPGVDPDLRSLPRHDARLDADALHFLCVANITPRKGHDVLIEALGMLDRHAWRCSLVGGLGQRPDYVAELQARAAQLGLSSRLDWVGAVPPAQVRDWYARTDLLVLPSRFETYGMVVAEAVASGLPVVCSDAGALPDTLPSGSGLLFETGDAAALAATLDGLLRDRSRLVNLRMCAHHVGARLGDWVTAARRFARVLGDFTASESSPDQRDRFALDWLQWREPVDAAARAVSLTLELQRWAVESVAVRGAQAGLQIVDLGCGTGSNMRYLSSQLPVSQAWVLVDHDPVLLEVASRVLPMARGPGGTTITACSRLFDLRQLPDFGGVPGCEPHLITASALIDLVSERWLRALVAWTVERRAALLVVLSVDGWTVMPDRHADDEAIRDAFNDHQRGPGPFGPGLGPEAVAVLQACLSGHGYQVRTASSAWRVDARHFALQRELLIGWERAASAQRPASRQRFRAWRDQRLRSVGRPGVEFAVGHLDLLALPGEFPAGAG
jgi:glycosyltransferase involved in cell wall biosynthesis